MTGLGSTTSSRKAARDACGRAVAPTFTCMHFVRFLCSLHGVCVIEGGLYFEKIFLAWSVEEMERRAYLLAPNR